MVAVPENETLWGAASFPQVKEQIRKASMHAPRRERTVAALASAAIVAGGLAALVTGLAIRLPLPSLPAALQTVLPTRELPERPRPAKMPSPSPTPVPTPVPTPAQMAEGSASPPDHGGKASPMVSAQSRRPPLAEPLPTVTATQPDSGNTANTGASNSSGPGQGAGGSGTGSGSGTAGEGYGSGDGYRRPAQLPRQISGKLHFADLPRDLRKSREGAELTLRYRIGVDGRASQCRILLSSGRPELDDHTCRTITERFRFRPARDKMGNPVPFVMTEIHGWSDVSD
ncbi:protein TonB [Novosphingobium mathurense]|uniref:Protein TonB n=2 Tax=Novosphingobium mathurense TaxID=428990 RepID=A0A1U6HKN3_9SPHN|nr:protein TonB [Novosphingobium mathurense]